MTKLPNLSLDKHLCFSLYAASRAILRLYRPYLDEIELTYPQYLVLMVLWEQNEVTVKSLGERLDLDSGTLTPMLKRMETRGLLKRQRAEDDERVVIIRLTEEGKALKDKATCIPKSLLESTGLSEKEVEEFNGTVKKILSVVNAVTKDQ
ncbi:MarR family winged helix-turn-helix transcriptional regulator [Heyndrickxia sp. NPDC080065]|uniref:MarR family winged helix-turn-helix transcriptional regulator n=1 Tax=Heyndrickxia sp. NPDC080065 TaxID=3390568 RepID=UPI003CFCD614